MQYKTVQFLGVSAEVKNNFLSNSGAHFFNIFIKPVEHQGLFFIILKLIFIVYQFLNIYEKF